MIQRLIDRARSSSLNYRLFVPLMLNTLVVQVAIACIRVTTSYRAIELGLPPIWLGIISASFAVLPLMLAVSVGRFIDRGHDALAMQIGGGILIVATIGFIFWSSPAGLIVCTSLLGISQMFLIAGQQMVCLRCGPPAQFENVFGHYMVANALGQGLGPYVVGWFGGGAAVPPIRLLFTVGLVAAVIAALFALMLRSRRKEERKSSTRDLTPVTELLRVPGLLSMVVLGVLSVTSQDLIIIYLPLLGTERQISVSDVGLLLSVRALASMTSRFFYARIVVATGRPRMMFASTIAAGLAFVALSLPLPLLGMGAAVAVIGFGVGLTTTVSITGLVTLVAPGARATANSLRMVGNRMGQLVFPVGAGLIAAAVGAGGIFAILAAGFAASTITQWRQNRPDADSA